MCVCVSEHVLPWVCVPCVCGVAWVGVLVIFKVFLEKGVEAARQYWCILRIRFVFWAVIWCPLFLSLGLLSVGYQPTTDKNLKWDFQVWDLYMYFFMNCNIYTMCACGTDIYIYIYINCVKWFIQVFKNVLKSSNFFNVKECLEWSWKLCFAVQVTGELKDNKRPLTKYPPVLFMRLFEAQFHTESHPLGRPVLSYCYYGIVT